MASAFIGLPVKIALRSGPKDFATGILSSLDPGQGTITLTEAQTSVGGAPKRAEGIKVLTRDEVAGLELLSVERRAANEQQQQPQQQNGQDGVRRGQQQAAVQSPQYASSAPSQPQHFEQHPRAAYGAPSPLPTPSPVSYSPQPSSSRSRGKRSNNSGSIRRRDNRSSNLDEGEDGDLSTAYVGQGKYDGRKRAGARAAQQAQPTSFDEDFDFSAALGSFDKARVFEDIRSQDTVDPSLRLVAHNRNPSRQQKMLPSENVLSSSELEQQQSERLAAVAARASASAMSREGSLTGGTGSESEYSSAAEGRTGGSLSAAEREAGVRRKQSGLRNLAGAGDGGDRVFITSSGRMKVPAIKQKQWREALSIAEIESSPSTSSRLSYSSLLLSQHVLALPSSIFPTPSPPHSRPTILILATEGEKALIALGAGTLLTHRGCRVAVLVPPEDGGAGGETWRAALRVLSSAGGRLVKDVADLAPTYNLILDALHPPPSPPSLSSSFSSSNLAASTSSLSLTSPRHDSAATFASTHVATALAFASPAVEWANGVDTVKIALDVPFGLDADKGSPFPSLPSPSGVFQPTHLFSYALPRAFLLSSASFLHKELESIAVVDVGFSPSVWERVGVEGFEPAVWGKEAWVEVEVR
ncbi:hypothetical protein JCM8547_005231 [Rhodosporidiobolus lusitaniae]